MFGIPTTSSHTVLASITALMLGTVAFVTLTAHGSGQNGRQRAVQIKTYKNQPADIVAVKVKGVPVESGRKFTGDSDWFNGMTVTVKNVTDKPIVWATVLVLAYHERDGKRIKTSDGRDTAVGTSLMYGVRPLIPGEPPLSYSATPLMPGQSADLVLSERWRDELYSLLRARDSSTDILELNLSLEEVSFYGDDETMWRNGFKHRRDPNNPRRWLVVDDPPRLNHSARNPKFLGAMMPGPNLGLTRFHLVDPPPRCTVRDTGIVNEQCSAYDTQGGLHCVWKNDTIQSSGYWNAILGTPYDKYCFVRC